MKIGLSFSFGHFIWQHCSLHECTCNQNGLSDPKDNTNKNYTMMKNRDAINGHYTALIDPRYSQTYLKGDILSNCCSENTAAWKAYYSLYSKVRKTTLYVSESRNIYPNKERLHDKNTAPRNLYLKMYILVQFSENLRPDNDLFSKH